MTTAAINNSSKKRRGKEKYEPPPPLVRATKHPIRFAENLTITLAYKLVLGAFFGVFAAAGIYWLITQTNYPIHHWWHSTIPDKVVRNNDRALFEGFLGGTLGIVFSWNHYKKKYHKELNSIESFMSNRLRIAMPNDKRPSSIWQLLFSPFLLIAGGVVGLALASVVAQHFGYGLGNRATGTSVFGEHVGGNFIGHVKTTINELVENWPVKLQGVCAAIFGRFLIKGVIDDLQLWFAEQAVLTGKVYGKIKMRLFPPGYVARFLEAKGNPGLSIKHRSKGTSYLMRSGIVVITLLAILGFAAINFNLPHVEEKETKAKVVHKQ